MCGDSASAAKGFAAARLCPGGAGFYLCGNRGAFVGGSEFSRNGAVLDSTAKTAFLPGICVAAHSGNWSFYFSEVAGCSESS
jgi:hypothetical protein